MTATHKLLTLANGVKVPSLAFGSGTAHFKRQEGDVDRAIVDIVKQALQQGFRHIDTAEVYNTERECGVALHEFLQESGLKRSDIFVTSKIFPHLDEPQQAVRASLEKLRVDYLDLYLIHAPFIKERLGTKERLGDKAAGITLAGAWSELEKMVDAGLVKSIGVSNYRIEDFEAFLPHARIKPVVNQVEFNPYLQQPELVAYCKKHGIAIAAYSPLMPLTGKTGGPLDEVVKDIATESGGSGKVTESQVLLKWNLLKGHIVVTTSSKSERIAEYLQADNVELSAEDAKRIDDAGAKLHFRKYWKEEFKGL
ncbi:hypothetical protein RI367_003024 [Sorochytrium milnesiophthora]